MDLGFETIGNATLICHDRGPVLATDPWIVGTAYFGSWTHSHGIPEEQMDAVKRCRYVWISHGHPDHLSVESLALLKTKTILLPDHVGGRIANDLRGMGFHVVILKDQEWTSLSPRIRVVCIADYNQDAILLVDLGGTLLVNLNDAVERGWGGFVKRAVRAYRESVLLKLFGFGDADMINFIDEDGRRIEPPAAERFPVGKAIQCYAESLGVRYVVPFSSLHKYQRSDSAWANQYTTRLTDYPIGFASTRCTLLPAFIRYDCTKRRVEEIHPPETPDLVVDPKTFGDDWSEPLERAEAKVLTRYFRAIEHLGKSLDFVAFHVGGREHVIAFKSRGFKTGVVFEAPRCSLMQAVEHECFDDLLIGNFMRTRLVGAWPKSGLYPDFTPYVTKYADNGRAKTEEELNRYFQEYRRRMPLAYLRHSLEHSVIRVFRSRVSPHSPLFYAAKTTVRRALGRI